MVKRCIYQRLEKVTITKSNGKCLKRKYFRDSPKRTKRMRKKKRARKKRKKRTKRKMTRTRNKRRRKT